MSSTQPQEEYLRALPLEHLQIHIQLLASLIEESDQFRTIEALHRALDKSLCAHHAVYFERSFTSEELQTISRYLVYRYHAFGIPLHTLPSGTDSSAPARTPPPAPSTTDSSTVKSERLDSALPQ